MNKGVLALAIGAAALIAIALPTGSAKADFAATAIANWLVGLPQGGTIWDEDSDHNACLSGWQLRQSQDGKIIWWYCNDGSG